MPKGALRYLGYLTGVAVVLGLTVVFAALHAMAGPRLSYGVDWQGFGDAAGDITNVLALHLVVYSLWGMVSFRMLARIGWACRPPWAHTLIGWVFLAAVFWVGSAAFTWGYATLFEAAILVVLVLASLGYALHHIGQMRAEAALERATLAQGFS